MEIQIIKMKAVTSKFDTFAVLRNGVQIGSGMHRKGFRSEWINDETGERFQSKDAFVDGFKKWLAA